MFYTYSHRLEIESLLIACKSKSINCFEKGGGKEEDNTIDEGSGNPEDEGLTLFLNIILLFLE